MGSRNCSEARRILWEPREPRATSWGHFIIDEKAKSVRSDQEPERSILFICSARCSGDSWQRTTTSVVKVGDGQQIKPSDSTARMCDGKEEKHPFYATRMMS